MLFVALFVLTMNEGQTLTIDFGAEKSGRDWQVILDGVMGGLSRGRATLTEDSMVFRGRISLANNGGFASLKGPFARVDLSRFEKVRIRYRSTGQNFALTLERERAWYRPYYKMGFDVSQGDWQVVELPLTEFGEYEIGRQTGREPRKNLLARTLRIGLISNEKRPSPFEIEIDYIEFY